MHQWSVRSTGIVAYLSTLNLVNYMSTDHQIDGCIENFDFFNRAQDTRHTQYSKTQEILHVIEAVSITFNVEVYSYHVHQTHHMHDYVVAYNGLPFAL